MTALSMRLLISIFFQIYIVKKNFSTKYKMKENKAKIKLILYDLEKKK